MNASLAVRHAVLGSSRDLIGDVRDIWRLAPQAAPQFKVRRLSVFPSALSFEELSSCVDEASESALRSYRTAFERFFEVLCNESPCFFLAEHWLRKAPVSRDSTDDTWLSALSRRLVGPVSIDDSVPSQRRLRTIARHLTEVPAGLLFVNAVPCVFRAHDDFGCFAVFRDEAVAKGLSGIATSAGLFFLEEGSLR
jgi:hypothetical protein